MFTALPRLRSLTRVFARLLVGMLLIAQALVAAHACEVALVGAAKNQTAVTAAHCHETPAPASDALCAKHCNADEQSSSHSAPGVPPMPAIAVLTVPVLSPVQQSSANGIATASPVSPATDPPPAILFHAFRS